MNLPQAYVSRMRALLGAEFDAFLESMAEAGKSVADALGDRIIYINVMNRLSVDCDCDGNPAEPDMHDIGILASADPVALDQACADAVLAQPAMPNSVLFDRECACNEGDHFHRAHPDTHWQVCLEHAEKLGIGTRDYELIKI